MLSGVKSGLGGGSESYQNKINLGIKKVISQVSVPYSTYLNSQLVVPMNGSTNSYLSDLVLNDIIYIARSPVPTGTAASSPPVAGYYKLIDNLTQYVFQSLTIVQTKYTATQGIGTSYDSGTLVLTGPLESFNNRTYSGNLVYAVNDYIYLPFQSLGNTTGVSPQPITGGPAPNGVYKVLSLGSDAFFNPMAPPGTQNQPGTAWTLQYMPNLLPPFRTNLFSDVGSVKRGYHQLTLKSYPSDDTTGIPDETISLTLFDFSSSENGIPKEECRVIDFVGCSYVSTESFSDVTPLRISTVRQFTGLGQSNFLVIKRIFPGENSSDRGDFSLEFMGNPTTINWVAHGVSTPTSGESVGALLSSSSTYRFTEMTQVTSNTLGAGSLVRNKSNIRNLSNDIRYHLDTLSVRPDAVESIDVSIKSQSNSFDSLNPQSYPNLDLVLPMNATTVNAGGFRIKEPGLYHIRWTCPAFGCDKFVSWLKVVNDHIDSVSGQNGGAVTYTTAEASVSPSSYPNGTAASGVYLGSTSFSSSSSSSAVVESTGEISLRVDPSAFNGQTVASLKGLYFVLFCTPTSTNSVAGKGLTMPIIPALTLDTTTNSQVFAQVVVTQLGL